MSWLPRVLAVWFVLALPTVALLCAAFGSLDLSDDWDERSRW